MKTELTGNVGYGRPPVDTRWKKGESGNPNGRPRGTIGFKRGARLLMKDILASDRKQKALARALIAGVFEGNPDCTEIVRDALSLQ